jgi:hypothetical protein
MLTVIHRNGSLKSAVTKYANTRQITFRWQSRFHDYIIRDADEYEPIGMHSAQKW